MPDFATVHDLTAYYGFPFKFREDQVNRVLLTYPYQKCALFDDAGTGKTAVSTALALAWGSEINIVIAPPILGKQWTNWLNSLKNSGAVVLYRGTPKKREKLPVASAKWLVMTIQIFKKDWNQLYELVGKRTSALLVDEASNISNVESDNFRAVYLWGNANHGKNRVVAITATPANNPSQAYAYIKLKTPSIYSSKTAFEDIHVVSRDERDVPTEWSGLDLVHQRMMLQAVRTRKEDVLSLKEPQMIPITYQLEHSHMKLYEQLVEELLLEIGADGVMDMTVASKMYHATQQMVTNWGMFADDTTKKSAAFDVLDNVIEETNCLQPEASKLIVFTYYKATSRGVMGHLKEKGINAVACYSEVSRAQQDKNIEAFLGDPSCRILVAQPTSAGYGLNPQAVCCEELFFEFPTNPMHFRQAMERIWRDGQKHVPTIRLAIAEGTIQQRLLSNLMRNDDMASQLSGNPKYLRTMLTGKEGPPPLSLNIKDFNLPTEGTY